MNYPGIRARVKEIEIQTTTVDCWDIKWGSFGEQNIPHPSPYPPVKVGMFAVFYRHSTLNSGPTLHGGVGEEKLYFPFLSWQNVILSPIVALKF